MSDLKQRLRSRKSVCDHYGNAGTILVNPDGESAIARIEELEAESARLNSLCDQMKIGWGEDAVRAEAAEAKLATATEALEAILTCWDGPAYKHVMGPNIDRARDAIRALKSTNQT